MTETKKSGAAAALDQQIEASQNNALCRAAQAIVERDYKPRPGTATAIAPNGTAYHRFKTRFYATASEAVRELEGHLRNLNVASSGDTVWWRLKPTVEFEIQNRKWQARARLALGWARDEKAEFTPGNEHPHAEGVIMVAAYPDDGAGVQAAPGLAGQLPRWKCHKVVEADKIVGVDGNIPAFQGSLILEGGAHIPVTSALYSRLPSLVTPVGGYYVRYKDGHESWSPADAFEDGYTRETL